MTTAGSMRGLASFMGITHQKLGRWLREGQEGGVKAIPTSAQEIIDTAFEAHRDISQAQALIDQIPFDPDAPVFAHRKALRNGMPGDRVFVEHTQHIRSDLREAIMVFIHESQRFYTLSIRSVVELALYLKQADLRTKKSRKRQTDYEAIAQAQLELSEEEGVEKKAIFTKIEYFGPRSNTYDAVREVTKKLRQKHEPATGVPGTALADQFLMQLIPANHVTFVRPAKAKKRARKSNQRIQGRGAK